MPASHNSTGGARSGKTTDEALPENVVRQLTEHGIEARGEVALRLELERYTQSYTLVKLTPAAARKWKARYRMLLAADILDAQTVTEAYARAILFTLANAESGVERDQLTTDA